MNVVLNGDDRQLPDQATLQWLIDDLGLAGKRLAVEVNEDIVPRSQHGDFRLSDGDRVEVDIEGIRTLEHCAAAAEGCKYANYVSFSAQFDDCSWFSTCDLPHLIGGAAFATRILRTTTALADPKLCSACTHPTLGGRAAPWCPLAPPASGVWFHP